MCCFVFPAGGLLVDPLGENLCCWFRYAEVHLRPLGMVWLLPSCLQVGRKGLLIFEDGLTGLLEDLYSVLHGGISL